jgi:hypothetical protein
MINARNRAGTIQTRSDSSSVRENIMETIDKRRPPTRTFHGWAISVLHEAGAIRECDDHGWMKDRADPHARDLALEIASKHHPAGLTARAAAQAVSEILDSIGDTCPEC